MEWRWNASISLPSESVLGTARGALDLPRAAVSTARRTSQQHGIPVRSRYRRTGQLDDPAAVAPGMIGSLSFLSPD